MASLVFCRRVNRLLLNRICGYMLGLFYDMICIILFFAEIMEKIDVLERN